MREFGEELRTVVKSIIPAKTPVHIVLDGLSEDREDEIQGNHSAYRIGPAQLQVCEAVLSVNNCISSSKLVSRSKSK